MRLLLLRVDRDHRLACRLRGNHRGVDVLELGVTVRIAAAFQRLAVHLPTVLQQPQQLGNAALGNPVPHRAQRRRQLRVALRDPQQRSHRIALRRRLQQPAQIFKQRCIHRGQRPSAAAGTPDHARQRVRIIEVFQTTANRAACDPRCPGRRADPAVTRRSGLGRREQTTAALVQATTNRRIPLPNR